MENLQRQLAEVEALRSIYCAEGEFELGFEEELAFGKLDTKQNVGGCGVSFTVHLRLLEWNLSVHFGCPDDYPESQAARVSVSSHGNVGRRQLQLLNSAATTAAEDCLGDESALQVLQKVQEAAWRIAEEEKASASVPCSMAGGVSMLLQRKLFWFHHIKSARKRKCIVDWGKELRVGGYCKPGFPGVLIVEAEDGDMTEYVRRVRRLRWQAMNLRALEEEQCSADQSVDGLRRFSTAQVEELDENDMSKLAALCREAKLEHMFLTALKLGGAR